MVVRIQLTGEMFKFEGSPELRNVSGWVDWRQFASVKDAAGTQAAYNEGDGSSAWAVHQDFVYPSRYVVLFDSTSYTYVLLIIDHSIIILVDI